MHKTIETAPRNGAFVILEDATQGTFAVARWSAKASRWIDDDDTPIQFNPTHWHLPQGLDGEVAPRRPDAPAQPSPVIAGGMAETPLAAKVRTQAASGDHRGTRKWPSIVAMAACLLIGVAFAPLLYRSDPGLQLLHSMGLDRDPGLKQALEQERARATRLAGDLATANEAADRSREAGERVLVGLREALRGEQAKAETLAGQLAEAQRDGAAQNARARETIDDSVKERDRIVATLREALNAQEVQASEARRKIEAEAAQARQTGVVMAEALRQERSKVDELRLALATMRREADAQVTTARSASGEAARLKEANARSAEALREAQARIEQLSKEVAAVRREIQAQASQIASAKAQAAGLKEAAERSVDEQRQALLQERAKTGKLTAELAETESTLQALTKAKAAEDSVRDSHLAEVQLELQRARADSAAARDALQAHLARIPQVEFMASGAAVHTEGHGSQRPAAPVLAVTSPASLPKAGAQATGPAGDALQTSRSASQSEAGADQPGSQAFRLLARANLMLDQGNIGAARNMLDRAAALGSAEALFWLAETYDPLFLPARNAIGTQSDIAKARALYGQALAAGIGDAKLRLESLDK